MELAIAALVALVAGAGGVFVYLRNVRRWVSVDDIPEEIVMKAANERVADKLKEAEEKVAKRLKEADEEIADVRRKAEII